MDTEPKILVTGTGGLADGKLLFFITILPFPALHVCSQVWLPGQPTILEMMRKRIIDQDPGKASAAEGKWLDVKDLAQVEVTSEDEAFPIEDAFETYDGSSGWRASEPGKQTIRVIFDEPQRIHTIHLYFQEEQHARTQEFLLRWSPDEGQSLREIVRQQYNFSPDSSTEEQETYTVNLEEVKVVELTIKPDVGGGSACASVLRFCMA